MGCLMRYLQYKGLMEREHKKSLKKIMYELCVEQQLGASEGAKKLGIARELFVYWRHYYRFEPRQMQFDEMVEKLTYYSVGEVDESFSGYLKNRL